MVMKSRDKGRTKPCTDQTVYRRQTWQGKLLHKLSTMSIWMDSPFVLPLNACTLVFYQMASHKSVGSVC